MEYKEALSILELSAEHSIEDIEKGYKRLASKFHPDKGGTDEDMALLNEAKSVLISQSCKENLPAIIEQFELAVRDMNSAAREQRNIERKVEKLERDVRNSATNRLKRWRQAALFFAALSAAAIFLGKDIPKEFIGQLQIPEIEKPAEVKEPIITETIKRYSDALSKHENDKKSDILKNFSETEQKEIATYIQNTENYKRYLMKTEEYAYIKRKNKEYTLMWYLFTFGIGIYAGFAAWFFNQKIHRVETELSEVNDELSIKSQYVRILKDIFNGDIPPAWTVKEIEFVIGGHEVNSESMKRIIGAIGTKKFIQFLLAKGQEMSFLKIKEGKEDNGYEETYLIA